jgi:hypothetical protein
MTAATLRAPGLVLPAGAADLLEATTRELLEGHRERLRAGVPGCSCGEAFPADAHREHARLHAAHVAGLVILHVLSAAAAAVRTGAETPATQAAVSAIAGMVRPRSNDNGKQPDEHP